MSSTDDDEPFQSAQIPQDQAYATSERLSDDDESSDALSFLEPSEEDQIAPITPDIEFPASVSPTVNDDDDSPAVETGIPDLPPAKSRPNKYHGPPSTWRNWTAPERALAASLEKLTAQDLSIHLYNTYKLKQRSRKSIQSRNNDSDVENTWEPPSSWAAWPLSPDIVPCEREGIRWEEGTELQRSPKVRSTLRSRDLGELLVAQVLRKARQQFQERHSRSPSVSDRDAPNPPSVNDPTRDIDEIELQSTSASPGIQDPHSPLVKDSSRDAVEVDLDKHVKPQKPVIMADDERASHILQPTIQHMIAQLDTFLMDLHYARSSYLVKDKDSASETQSTVRGRFKSQVSVNKRKRSIADIKTDSDSSEGSDSSNGSMAEHDTAIGSTSRSKSRSKRPKATSTQRRRRSIHDRKQRLGLRDWSDVLGVAAMTGWPLAVIERATARCTDLFGEGLSFRTFNEAKCTETTIVPGLDGPMTTIESAPSSKNCLETVGGVHIDGFLQPVEGKKSWKYSHNESQRGSLVRKGKK